MKKTLIIAALALTSAAASAHGYGDGDGYRGRGEYRGGNGGDVAAGAAIGGLAASLALTISADVANRNSYSSNYKQIVVDSQEDAAMFVMSSGSEGRTAKLNKAFGMVRSAHPDVRASDLDVAEAILQVK